MNTGDSSRRGLGGDGARAPVAAAGRRAGVWFGLLRPEPHRMGRPGRPRPSVVVRAAKFLGRPISRLLVIGRQ